MMVVQTDENGLLLSGLFLCNDKKEVLLLRRKDKGTLETPGGKVEEDDCKDLKTAGVTVDDLSRTAVRELFEELEQSIIIEEMSYVGPFQFSFKDGIEGIAHKFVSKIVFGAPRIQETDSFSEIVWVPIKDFCSRKDLSTDIMQNCTSLKNKLESFVNT
ncbi:MAG: NUDIX hydrolase [Nanobdellota archaeon]